MNLPFTSSRFSGVGTDTSLATMVEPHSPVAEAYRVLRGNILFSSVDNPVKSLLLTTPRPDAGKSALVANLAVVAAQSGSRVALVDCDLRHPAQHTIFGVSNTHGFTDYLFSNELGTPAKGDYLAQTNVENLWLLPSGPLPANPAELLGSSRLAAALDRLKAAFDLVLFDAPPILAVADTALLAARLDGTILAIAAGRTKRDEARQAKEQLVRVHANILGVVMTDVPGAAQTYGY